MADPTSPRNTTDCATALGTAQDVFKTLAARCSWLFLLLISLLFALLSRAYIKLATRPVLEDREREAGTYPPSETERAQQTTLTMQAPHEIVSQQPRSYIVLSRHEPQLSANTPIVSEQYQHPRTDLPHHEPTYSKAQGKHIAVQFWPTEQSRTDFEGHSEVQTRAQRLAGKFAPYAPWVLALLRRSVRSRRAPERFRI